MARHDSSISESFSSVAVVGAGPSGIATLKELDRIGIDASCFEAATALAPRWSSCGEGEPSPVYDSLHLNNASKRMRFSEKPMAAHHGNYATAYQLHSYLADVSASLGLTERISYTARVLKIERSEEGWVLQFASRPRHRSKCVVVATGLNAVRILPPWAESFAGSVMHTEDYRRPDQFESAHVLVVGSGNSGAEIASELVSVAASVDLAASRPFHVVPREIGGFPCDLLDGPATSRLPLRLRQAIHDLALCPATRRARLAGLKQPTCALLRSDWTISSDLVNHLATGAIELRPRLVDCNGSRVSFADGTVGRFDAIVFATGYEPGLPALPAGPPISRTANGCYLKIVPPNQVRLGDVYFVGFLLPLGALLPVVEAQARWVARTIGGLTELPSGGEMERAVCVEHRESVSRFSGSTAPGLLADPYPYIRHLNKCSQQ